MKLAVVALLIAGAAHADPKIPQEVTDLAKMLAGTWRCAGTMQLPGDAQPAALTATLRSKTELDGFWIHDSFDAKAGKTHVKWEAYMTFDGKKWRRVLLDNNGNQVLGSADGVKDGKIDFNLDWIGATAPTQQSREHFDATDPKVLKLSQESSADKGKTWTKRHEMTCKR